MATSASICFYGTFRDEAKHLPTMLEKMEPFTDCYAFLEGGVSTDKTARIIRQWLKTHDGVFVQHRRWQGIERAQNAALKLARSTGADYVYTGGGGEVYTQVAPLPELVHNVYMIRTVGEMQWWMPSLVKASVDCRWKMPTHSFLHLPDDIHAVGLTCIERTDTAYEDRRDGKLRRDKVVLKRYLKRHPGDSRALFYLAQTLRCLGEHEKAAALYIERSQIDEHEEERWYSHLMAAALQVNTHELLTAWEARPWRAEPLRTLEQLYRGAGCNLLADFFQNQADQIPYPKGELLFVHANDYKQAA